MASILAFNVMDERDHCLMRELAIHVGGHRWMAGLPKHTGSRAVIAHRNFVRVGFAPPSSRSQEDPRKKECTGFNAEKLVELFVDGTEVICLWSGPRKAEVD